MKKILNKKGEGYIDVVVLVLVVAFLLVFTVSMFSIISVKEDMRYMCEEVLNYATSEGTVDFEVYERFLVLCEEKGFTPELLVTSCSFDEASGKVQLGETITINLKYTTSLIGFGGFSLPLDLEVTMSGLSQVYWK